MKLKLSKKDKQAKKETDAAKSIIVGDGKVSNAKAKDKVQLNVEKPETKPKESAAPNTPKAVVADLTNGGKAAAGHRQTGKKTFIMVFAVVGVLSLAAGGYWYSQTRSQQAGSYENGMVQDITYRNALEDKAANGDVDGAINEVDAAIATTNSSDDKSVLLQQKAKVVANYDSTDKGIILALEAYNTHPTLDGANLLGSLYRIKEDDKNAGLYYKKALEHYYEQPVRDEIFESRLQWNATMGEDAQ